MHAVIRTYVGAGANELFDLLEQHKSEVDLMMRSIEGFVSYLLLRTGDGGATVTICRDKTGTDESTRTARQWIASNASHIRAAAPSVSEGPVILHVTGEAPPVTQAMPLPTVS